MDTIKTTMTHGEMYALVRQARREGDAQRAGYATHADQLAAHRAERDARLRARLERRAGEASRGRE